MREVTVIGLGLMGTALARELLRSGSRVTVWNRSIAKAAPLVSEGAVLAPSAAAAAQASGIVITCITDYRATYGVLEGRDVISSLAGKVLVQLSTGSPEDARTLEAWAKQRGIDYLDGAILATPSQMGKPESSILVSGSGSAYEKSKPLLESTAGTVSYLGEKVGWAAAMDLAFLSHLFAGLLGFYHGARICEAEGIRVADFGAMAAVVAPAIGGMVKHDADSIQSGAYEASEATLEICAQAIELIQRHAREARINAELPAFAAALFRKGVAAGHGAESPAALIKVFRESA